MATALNDDADQGRAELTVGETTYTRTLHREKSVVTGGDPSLEDATLADLFAFLLETSDARQALTGGSALRDVIMCPVDTAEIEREIDRLKPRQDNIDKQIEEFDQIRQQLPAVERIKSKSWNEIIEKRGHLSDIQVDYRISDNILARKKKKMLYLGRK